MDNDLKDLLEEKYFQYNKNEFIELDPILIPHSYTKKEDIEISGFLSSTIAWGNRKSIINNASKLMTWMDHSPFEFVTNYSKKELKTFKTFVHRTFNGADCVFFLESIRNIYLKHGGLEIVFSKNLKKDQNIGIAISEFRKVFFELEHLNRTQKHISDPSRNSSAKRLCMFLRWMVRKDNKGVDFGIWKSIKPSQLCLPLDVHTGNVGRKLGLLERKQNDWKAVEEITSLLKTYDPKDPVKYDFALFGMGVNKDLNF